MKYAVQDWIGDWCSYETYETAEAANEAALSLWESLGFMEKAKHHVISCLEETETAFPGSFDSDDRFYLPF